LTRPEKSTIGSRFRLVVHAYQQLLMRWLPLLILALAVSPSLVWNLLDRSVWTWDQSWYAYNTVTLYNSLITSPLGWIHDLISACYAQPPAIAWLGQFFVPLSHYTGSVNSALILSIILTNLFSLVLIYRSIFELTNGRQLIAFVSAITIASGPLFIAMSHQYFAESVQLLTVCWFFLIMSKARNWPRFRLTCHLILATTVAMAAKSSSPLYFFSLVFLAILGSFLRESADHYNPKPRNIVSKGEKFSLLISIVIMPILVINWYLLNFRSMQEHVKISASSENWGARDTFFNKFYFWSNAFSDHFFLRLTLLFTLLLLFSAFFVTLIYFIRNRLYYFSYFDLAAAVSVAQILVTLSIFSHVPNEDGRYLLPLAPFVAILVGWSLAKLTRPWLWVALAIYSTQLFYVHAEALAIFPRQGNSIPWLTSVDTNPYLSRKVFEIVSKTCPLFDLKKSTKIELGADLSSVNSFSLNYVASTLSPGFVGLSRKPCEYLNSIKMTNSLQPLIKSLATNKPTYLVIIEDLTKLPSSMAPVFTNQASNQVSSTFAKAHGFVLENLIHDFSGTSILIYRKP